MVPVRRLPAVLALALLAAGLPAGPAGAKLRWHVCRSVGGFECAVLRVPLDRSHRLRGAIGLQVARQIARPPGARMLVALSGGPGQSAVSVAPAVADSLRAARRRYRIYVLDQRGTGGSGVLRCPALQRTSQLDLDVSTLVAGCARRLGGRRNHYSTNDSIADLDALRRAVGAPTLALQGISYGTYVAVQYARAHPRRVDRLVLDSVVGPDGVPPLLTDSWSALPRVLGELCAGGSCAGITNDLLGDVRTLLARLESAPLRGTIVDGTGRRRPARLRTDDLLGMLVAADLNPHLQAALPATVASALRGDAAPILRLVRPAAGPVQAATELSVALNVATTCADTRLDYALSLAIADRPPRIDAAAGALPDSAIGPLDRALVERTSVDQECRLWPPADITPPARGPLPDVPALLLSGRLDDRTPLENALALARQLPRATVVAVPGTGHDETDTDLSGCIGRAYARFFSGQPVPGAICARISNQVPPQASPPGSVAALAGEPGVSGARGQVLRAAVGALDDARESWAQLADAGFAATTGGGLRGGSWRTEANDAIVLRGVAWAPEVRVSGRVGGLLLGRWSGTLTVAAPGGLGGRLRLDARRGVSGVLGGRSVRLAAHYVRGALQRSLLGGSPRAAAGQLAHAAAAPHKR